MFVWLPYFEGVASDISALATLLAEVVLKIDLGVTNNYLRQS